MKIAFTLSALKKQLGVSALLLGAVINSQAQASLVAGWHFNGYGSESTVAADYGSGTIYMDGSQGSDSWSGNANFAGATQNTGDFPSPTPPAGASLSLVGTNNNGKALVIKFSMTGYSDLNVSFAARGTSTGYDVGTWAYSTNGTTWTPISGNTATRSTSFSSKSLPTITGLNNAATAYLRYTLNGASSTSGNNRIDNLSLTATGNPLAIVLGNITAANKGKENLVSWNSLTEEKGDAFVLERSNNGTDFQPLYHVNAKGVAGKYSYTDQQPYEGMNYYRLYLMNNDGGRTYSKTVTAEAKGNGFVMSAYPNPATAELTVSVSGATKETLISLIDLNGKIVRSYPVTTQQAGMIHMDIKNLQPGYYFLRSDDGRNVQTIKISKQ